MEDEEEVLDDVPVAGADVDDAGADAEGVLEVDVADDLGPAVLEAPLELILDVDDVFWSLGVLVVATVPCFCFP